MNRILVVEDDARLAEGLVRLLSRAGFDVTHVASLASARAMWAMAGRNTAFDVVILDWNLPDGEGVDLLRDAREEAGGPPVILLTARTETAHRVGGLDAGAVDYVTKPFDPDELLARVRVQLRRGTGGTRVRGEDVAVAPAADARGNDGPVESAFTEGRFRVDTATRRAEFEGREIALTRLEFDLLAFLLRHADRVYTREELLLKVWGSAAGLTTRTVDTHVAQIRRKTASEPFETLRGVGYRYRRERA